MLLHGERNVTTMPIKLDQPQHKEDTQLGDEPISSDQEEAVHLT